MTFSTREEWEACTDPAAILRHAIETGISPYRLMKLLANIIAGPSEKYAELQKTTDKIRRCLSDPGEKWDPETPFEVDIKRMCLDTPADVRAVGRVVDMILADYAEFGWRKSDSENAVCNRIRAAIPWETVAPTAKNEPEPEAPSVPKPAGAPPAGTPPAGTILGKTHYAYTWACPEGCCHATIKEIPVDWADPYMRKSVWRSLAYPTQEIAEAYARAKLREMGELPPSTELVTIHGKTATGSVEQRGGGGIPWLAEARGADNRLAWQWRRTETEALDTCVRLVEQIDKEYESTLETKTATIEITNPTLTINGKPYEGDEAVTKAILEAVKKAEEAQRAIVEGLERAAERGKTPRKTTERESMSDTLEPVDTGSVDYARLCLRAQALAVECTSMDARRALCMEVLILCLTTQHLNADVKLSVKAQLNRIERAEAPVAEGYVGPSARDACVHGIAFSLLPGMLDDSASIRKEYADEMIRALSRLGIKQMQILGALDRAERAIAAAAGREPPGPFRIAGFLDPNAEGFSYYKEARQETLHTTTSGPMTPWPGRWVLLPHDTTKPVVSGIVSVDKDGTHSFTPDQPQETTTMSKDPTPSPAPTTQTTSQHVLATLRTDATDAAWRTAGAQFVKLARDPFIALLSRHLAPGDESLRARIAAFLETEIGTALFASVLSAGLSAMPRAGEVPQKLARELRVAAMADAGDVVADLLMGPLRTVASLYLEDPAHTIGVQAPALEEPGNVVGIGAVREKAVAG